MKTTFAQLQRKHDNQHPPEPDEYYECTVCQNMIHESTSCDICESDNNVDDKLLLESYTQ